MYSEKISGQLDTIIALLKMTNQDTLVAVREGLDDVSKALLTATAEPVVVGKLKKDVAKTTSQSEKTVQRRIGDLFHLHSAVHEDAQRGGGLAQTWEPAA